jgi:hypothetical protein
MRRHKPLERSNADFQPLGSLNASHARGLYHSEVDATMRVWREASQRVALSDNRTIIYIMQIISRDNENEAGF